MNQYQTYFHETVGNRDIIYQYFLNFLGKKPATILEIGAARNLNLICRHSDGWSSIFFAEYVNQFGGEHLVVDISEDSLVNCRTILEGYSDRTRFIQMDGAQALREFEPTAVLLDGSDDPDQMAEQLALIKPHVPVLCDDFQSKGPVVRDQRTDFILFDWTPHPPKMAMYHSGLPAHTINIPTIHR